MSSINSLKESYDNMNVIYSHIVADLPRINNIIADANSAISASASTINTTNYSTDNVRLNAEVRGYADKLKTNAEEIKKHLTSIKTLLEAI